MICAGVRGGWCEVGGRPFWMVFGVVYSFYVQPYLSVPAYNALEIFPWPYLLDDFVTHRRSG
jgi:hypothetical protein